MRVRLGTSCSFIRRFVAWLTVEMYSTRGRKCNLKKIMLRRTRFSESKIFSSFPLVFVNLLLRPSKRVFPPPRHVCVTKNKAAHSFSIFFCKKRKASQLFPSGSGPLTAFPAQMWLFHLSLRSSLKDAPPLRFPEWAGSYSKGRLLFWLHFHLPAEKSDQPKFIHCFPQGVFFFWQMFTLSEVSSFCTRVANCFIFAAT